MKKLIFLNLCLMVLNVFGQEQTKFVERPTFYVSNATAVRAAEPSASKDNKQGVLHELPNVPMEKMFDAILAKYKGKVVFIDFWATWCGPCMAAMKSIEPVKEEMKNKDVVFLYLTGETSPLNAFTQAYPDISGEHYRVSAAQWKYWSNTFGIRGIPFYMTYDRQGMP